MGARVGAYMRLGLLAVALLASAIPTCALAAGAPVRAHTHISVSASSKTAKISRKLTITGRLISASGRPLANRKLVFERRWGTSKVWTLLARGTTNSTGRMSCKVQPPVTAYYRFRFAGSHAERPASAIQKILGHHYRIRFQDEFTGSAVNTAVWTPSLRWGDTSANLLSVFSPDALEVTRGTLVITASTSAPADDTAYPYVSGAISGFGADQFHFKYGYVETRAMIPRGMGLWPAVWMLPTESANGCEIDILEARGQLPCRNLMTVHWGTEQAGRSYEGDDLSTGYHTFAVDWSPTRVIWYRDGIERFRVDGRDKVPHDFMYLIANMQVGGWAGSPDDSTVVPAEFHVDYIRVYQHN